jgi:hypothetical protein
MKFKKFGLFVFLGLLCLFQQIAYADTSDDDDTGDNNEDSKIVVPAKASDAIGSMLLQSISLIGIPYRWGGNTPETGMDCSGFIRYLYKTSLGINLPRTASEMAKVGKRVKIDDLEPGDLLFFNTRRGANTHVGMYLGNDKMIVAPRTGQDIQISALNGFFRKHFNGAKRIVQENEDDSGKTSLVDYHDDHDEALPGGNYRRHSGHKNSRKKSKHHTKVHNAKIIKTAKKNKVTKKPAHKTRSKGKKKIR